MIRVFFMYTYKYVLFGHKYFINLQCKTHYLVQPP